MGHSHRTRSTGTLSGLGSALALISRSIPTCSAMLAATRWRTPDTTPGRSRTGSAIGRFSTPSVIRSYRRPALLGKRAGFDFQVHTHMLRHACGYALANAGHDTRAIQDWLGHRSDLAHRPLYGAIADPL